MKKVISMLLVVALCFSNVSIARAEDELTDNQKAIAIIDGFINEMKELGYDSFYRETLFNSDDMTDSYLWKERLINALGKIKINNHSLGIYLDPFYSVPDYYKNYGSAYSEGIIYIPDYVLEIDNPYNNPNYYNVYLSTLLFYEKVLENDVPTSLQKLIDESKELNNFDLNYRMWLYDVYFLVMDGSKKDYDSGESFNYYGHKNLNFKASKTYIWQTLYKKQSELFDQIDSEDKFKYSTRAERLDGFVKCLELLVEELNNPFIEKMTINVSVEKTAYDKYAEQQKAKTTNSKTDTNKTSNAITKKCVSVSGKKVSGLKLIAKKGKIKVSFAKLKNATSYEIQISTNKKFKKAKKYTTKKTSKTIKKLKQKKTYYVRVRAVRGNTKSKWVKKKIKTK